MPPRNTMAIPKASMALLLRERSLDRKLLMPDEASSSSLRMVAASANRFDCNSGMQAPLQGTSYDPASFAISGNAITIKQPGVYLVTGKVFFALYDNENDDGSSSWGNIQQASMNITTADGMYAPVVEGTPFAGYYTKNEELIRFTEIITTWQNNQKFVLRAGATYGRPHDHPVVLRATVSRLKILRL